MCMVCVAQEALVIHVHALCGLGCISSIVIHVHVLLSVVCEKL